MNWNSLFRVLGKMSTAVAVLLALALVSVVGTFVPQDMGVSGENLYGSFWHAVFARIGLYDVYRAPWFLAALFFLVASVGVCVWRQGGVILRKFPNINVRQAGYLTVHTGVLLLACSGLVSGFFGVRATLNLRDGETDRTAWRFEGDVPVAVPLPFAVRNDGFKMEIYETGMPSRFASDLSFLEKGNVQKQVEVAVNRPVSYRDYTFYQASFGDGGSPVTVAIRTLGAPGIVEKESQIYNKISGDEGAEISFLDLHLHTVENVARDEGGAAKFADVGPSLDYSVRRPEGGVYRLRSYLNLDGVIGVETGVNDDGTPVFSPVYLGVSFDDKEAWAILTDYFQREETRGGGPGNAPDIAALRQLSTAHLAGLPAEERLQRALQLLQAAQMMGELNLTHLVRLVDFTPIRYTGLQVSYDPGVTLFWLSCGLLVLGICLMSWRRGVADS